MSAFQPLTVFPRVSSVPKSYYLSHHAAALKKMRAMLSSVDLIIECRDYRTPLSSRNPLFEEDFKDRPRVIVYTKQDLGSKGAAADKQQEAIIRKWDSPSTSLFADIKSRRGINQIIDAAKRHAHASTSLLGTRALVVGMPNVGKSSLLNALRNVSLGLKNAAQIGNQPGVTRKMGTHVKIINAEGEHGAVYVLDTPGIFVPYMADHDAMMKLALCGNIKESLVPPPNLAEYLLYHINLHDPALYSVFANPTNDIRLVLDGVATRFGLLKKGGGHDYEAAAIRFVQRWRAGEIGRFVLDTVTEDAAEMQKQKLDALGGSMNQAKKAAKQSRKEAYLNSG